MHISIGLMHYSTLSIYTDLPKITTLYSAGLVEKLDM